MQKKKGIFSDKLEIPINWGKSEGLKVDVEKPMTYEKRGSFKTNNNKNTFEELALFSKYSAKFKGVLINFDFRRDGRDFWSSVNFDENLLLNNEIIENHIEFMRSSIGADDKFESSLQITGIQFGSGQLFLDWIADKQLQISMLKQEEINQ